MATRLVIVLLAAAVCQQQVSCRLVRQDRGAAAGSRPRKLSQAPATATAGNKYIPGQYIVIFKKNAGDAKTAASRLMDQVRGSRSGVASIGDTVPLSYTIIGSDDSSADNAAAAAAAVPADGLVTAESAAQQRSVETSAAGVQSIVASGVDDATLAAIQAADVTNDVFPDQYVSLGIMDLTPLTPERRCAAASSVSAGVQSSNVKPADLAKYWPGSDCLIDTKVVFVGERCGSSFNQIQYRAIYAVDTATGAAKKTKSGKSCEVWPSSMDAKGRNQYFGNCGRAPLLAKDLMIFVCSSFGCVSSRSVAPASAELTARLTLKQPVKCGNKRTDTLTYNGTPCGRGNQYIQWTKATGAGGCTISRSSTRAQFKAAHDVFGSCGAGPGLSYQQVAMSVCPPTVDPSPSPRPKPSPKPNPTDGSLDWVPLKKTALAAGEGTPRGVTLIEAVDEDMVDDVTTVVNQQRVVVGVIDSGVDSTHPDINYIDGKSWITAAGDDDPAVDRYGHGTHIAGIVGAMNGNSSRGIVGVSPGTGVFSLKVFDGNGNGMLSKTLEAVKWVATDGIKKGIKVINLSLVAEYDPTLSNFKQITDAVCQYFQEASDAGVTIAAAAGNYGRSIKSFVPALCPTVLSVTSLDQDATAPADWSDFADAADASQKAHTIAAPGTGIVSTVPKSVDPSGYLELGGTSMASPHVAGVAANCIMSGACSGPRGADNIPAILKAAQIRYKAGDYVKYDPAQLKDASKYYGNFLWSGF